MFSKKSFPCFCLVIEADVHGAEFLIFMIIIFISNLSIHLMSVFVCSSNQNLLKDTTLVWVRSTFWSSRRFLSRLVLNFHFPTCGYLVTGEWLIPVCVMKIIWRVAYWKNPLQAGTCMFFNCWTECNEFETDKHECGLEELTGRNISYWYQMSIESCHNINNYDIQDNIYGLKQYFDVFPRKGLARSLHSTKIRISKLISLLQNHGASQSFLSERYWIQKCTPVSKFLERSGSWMPLWP